MAGKSEFVEKYLGIQEGSEDVLREMVRVMVQGVMQEEVSRHVGAQAYERSAQRLGRRNGVKPRSLKTRVGELDLSVPQVRDMAPYQPSLFGRWQRTERALLVACAEMYFMGVSTRKVGSVLEKLGGFSLSAATVSQVASELDERLTEFRERRLDFAQWPYLVVDATYVKTRVHGRVVSRAVLVVAGITQQGRREVLTWQVGESESEENWGKVFRELKVRGLKGVELVVSDGHEGIQAALKRAFPQAAWQRCRVHFMRNALAKAGHKEGKEAARDLRTLFAPEEPRLCMEVAEEIALKWERRKPALARQIREQAEQCLSVQHLPANLRRRLNSTNMLERVMKEIKRRTNVVGIFPNDAACNRLAGAHLLEIHEAWLCEAARYAIPQGKE
jgi:putative transposase